MSYCRFSSDDWRCDVYAYESDDGFYTMTAANRYAGEVPRIDWQTEDFEVFHASYLAQHEYLRTCERLPIDSEYAGETWVDDDLESFEERLRWLQSEGFLIPEWTFAAIAEERAAERAAELVDKLGFVTPPHAGQ